MSDTSGGMFSKLINPDTAKPRILPVSQTADTSVAEVKKAVVIPTKTSPAPKVKSGKKTPSPLLKADTGNNKSRKQVSAYLSPAQLAVLKQLYFKLNDGEGKIEKSEIIGVGIEIVSALLGTQVPKYSSIQQVREYLSTQVSKCLSTQVPKHPST